MVKQWAPAWVLPHGVDATAGGLAPASAPGGWTLLLAAVGATSAAAGLLLWARGWAEPAQQAPSRLTVYGVKPLGEDPGIASLT